MLQDVVSSKKDLEVADVVLLIRERIHTKDTRVRRFLIAWVHLSSFALLFACDDELLSESDKFHHDFGHAERVLFRLQNPVMIVNSLVFRIQSISGCRLQLETLHTVPGLPLVDFLPEILDGLFGILSDPNEKLQEATEAVLGEFLSALKRQPAHLKIHDMVHTWSRSW